MNMNKFTTAAALLCVGCSIFAAGAPKSPKVQVTVGKVFESEDLQSHRYTGLITSPAVVNLSAHVSGELLEIGFKEGDFVKTEQMLYRLEDIRYEAMVKSCEAKINECKAKVDYSQSNYDRNHELYKNKATSKDNMENTLSTLKANKAALLAAEAELITAKYDLKNTRIIAPIDGIIGVTQYTRGNYITPNSGTLATIIQINPLRVRFSLSNRDFLSTFISLDDLKANARIKIQLANDAFYEKEGVVELVNNEANRKTDTINIYASFENPEHKLIPGSTVSVFLSRKDGVKHPAVLPSAVMHDNKNAYVYVVNDKNIVEKRNVILGNMSSEVQLIKSGLKIGEKIVIDGTHKVMPDAEIIPDFKEVI